MTFSRSLLALSAVALRGVFADEKFEIKTDSKYDATGSPEEAGKQFMEDAAKDPKVVKLDSGLMYKVLNKGEGKVHPLASTPCDCHYEGKLVNGDVFDSSYARGEPTGFAPNQVIRGWTEAMQLMVEGDKWEMYIPYDLAYGESGSPPKIPGKSTLVFTMEIVKVKGEGKSAVSCDPATGDQCTDKETKYVEKMKKKSAEDLKLEYIRLAKMQAENAKSKNLKMGQRKWLDERTKIVKKMVDKEEL